MAFPKMRLSSTKKQIWYCRGSFRYTKDYEPGYYFLNAKLKRIVLQHTKGIDMAIMDNLALDPFVAPLFISPLH